MPLSGSCFCGRVPYRIGALPQRRSCHCSRCRKAFSGSGSVYAEVTPGSFSWVSGEENLTQYESRPVCVSVKPAGPHSVECIKAKCMESLWVPLTAN